MAPLRKARRSQSGPMDQIAKTSRGTLPGMLASHVGLGMHPAALYAVADRLAQPEGKWKKFDRSGWKQWFYRDPFRSADQVF